MTHSIAETDFANTNEANDPFDIVVDSDRDPYRGLRVKPEDRIARGMPVEDFFGICAEEFDDEYMEAVLAIRRGRWLPERHS